MKMLRAFTITVFLLCAFSFSIAAQTITLVPNGSDDTASIQAALNQCVGLKKMCTIRFAPGEFFVSPVIADNFRGTIKGAGQGKTILTLKGIQLKDNFYFEPWSATNPQPNMFTFRGGDITISRLTMRALGRNPLPLYCYLPGVCFTALQSFVVVTRLPESKAETNSRIEDIAIIADEGDINGASNTNNAISWGGLFFQPKMEYGGTHVLRNSHFDRCHVFFLGARNVKFTAHGNVFRRSSIALDAWQLDNSEVTISRNDIEATWTGLGAVQLTSWDPDGWVPKNPSSWLIANNHIRIIRNRPEPGEGIFVMDAFHNLPSDQRKTMLNALIFNNKIEMSAGSRNAIALYGTKNTAVVLNRMTGKGQSGIAAYGAKSCALRKNKVRGFEASLAHIYLAATGEATGGNPGLPATYPDTTDCLVVTDSPADHVIDEGSNNTVINRP